MVLSPSNLPPAAARVTSPAKCLGGAVQFAATPQKPDPWKDYDPSWEGLKARWAPSELWKVMKRYLIAVGLGTTILVPVVAYVERENVLREMAIRSTVEEMYGKEAIKALEFGYNENRNHRVTGTLNTPRGTVKLDHSTYEWAGFLGANLWGQQIKDTPKCPAEPQRCLEANLMQAELRKMTALKDIVVDPKTATAEFTFRLLNQIPTSQLPKELSALPFDFGLTVRVDWPKFKKALPALQQLQAKNPDASAAEIALTVFTGQF